MPHAPLPPDEIVQHAAFLRRLGRSLLIDPEHAADATQDALLTGLEQGPRDPARARGWLAQVFRNAARQTRRRSARRSARERLVSSGERLEPAVDAVARRELMRRVADAVMALAPAQREVVHLRYYDGLPPRKIAERLATPVATIKSRLGRALTSLRTALDDGECRGVAPWTLALGPLVGTDGPGAATHIATWTGGSIVNAKYILISPAIARESYAAVVVTLHFVRPRSDPSWGCSRRCQDSSGRSGPRARSCSRSAGQRGRGTR